MEYVIKINHDGQVEKVQCEKLELDTLQDMVGGNIEIVRIGLPSCMGGNRLVVNEEGKLMGLPHNELATVISGLYRYDCIAGDAVLAKASGEEIHGFNSETSDDLMNTLRRLL